MKSDHSADFVIGVDLGATHCRAGIFSLGGVAGNRLERKLPDSDGPERQTHLILDQIKELLTGEEAARLLGIGIGSCGPIDRDRTVILEAPNRPGWVNVPIRALLHNEFQVPVFLENDANVAALGEYRRGAGIGVESLLGLTLGTGVGGGFIQRGEILAGAEGMAMEVGHMYIGGEGIRCCCGAIDCLELYVSAEGIKGTWRRRTEDKQEISCHDIFRLARNGDEAASSVIRNAALYLGRAIASLQKILDPEMIVIGGGLARETDLLVDPAIDEALRNMFRSRRNSVTIVPAALGTDSGLAGAAELAISGLETPTAP